jgi:hypothetical protein
MGQAGEIFTASPTRKTVDMDIGPFSSSIEREAGEFAAPGCSVSMCSYGKGYTSAKPLEFG